MSSRLKKHTGKKYLVLYNPNSGKKRFNVDTRIHNFFKKHNLDYTFLDISQSTNEKILKKIDKNITRILIVGGDGTLRNFIELFYFHKIDKPIAFIPCGTANIVAQSLDLPIKLNKALKNAIKGHEKPFDIGLVNDKNVFFIAMVLGKIAEVSVGPSRAEKEKLGFLAYLIKMNKVITQFKLFANILDIKNKNKEIHSIMICNHLNLRPIRPWRGVEPDDGLLDMFEISNTSAFGLFQAIFDFYRKRGDTQILKHQLIKEIKINAEKFEIVNLDGDPMEEKTKKYHIKVIPNRIKIII